MEISSEVLKKIVDVSCQMFQARPDRLHTLIGRWANECRELLESWPEELDRNSEHYEIAYRCLGMILNYPHKMDKEIYGVLLPEKTDLIALDDKMSAEMTAKS